MHNRSWIFACLAHRWFVRPDIERIFKFRTEALQNGYAVSEPVRP